LADQSGIDLPRDLERVFIIEELLELETDAEEDVETPGADPPAEVDILEPAFLPEHYNITFIDILIRDPLWVFAFWEIKEQDKELYEGDADFGGYYLQAVPTDKRPDSGDDPLHEGKSFTIPVGPDDNAWYVNFPLGGRFKIELKVSLKNRETLLAVSRPFKLSQLLPPSARARPAVLSGIDELPVLRNTDRLSRILQNHHS
jgi:hypothetical protein